MYRQKRSLRSAIARLSKQLGIDQADVVQAVTDELNCSYAKWLAPLDVRLPELDAQIAKLSREDARLRRQLEAADDSVSRLSQKVSDHTTLLESKTATLASLGAKEQRLRDELSEVSKALREATKGVDTIKYQLMMKSSKKRHLASGQERFLRILLTLFTILGIAIAVALILRRT